MCVFYKSINSISVGLMKLYVGHVHIVYEVRIDTDICTQYNETVKDSRILY